MKKILIIIFLFIAILGTVSSLEVNIPSEVYNKQNFVAEISGEFYDQLTENNLFLYRKNLKVPAKFEIEKVQNSYYVYTFLDKPEGNYSFVIENLKYFEDNQLTDEEIRENFIIKNESADFYLESLFISTNENFLIKAINPNEKEIEIEINSELVKEREIKINPNSFEEILVDIGNIEESSWNSIKIASEKNNYTFQAYIEVEEEIEEPELSFIISPSKFRINLPTNSTTYRVIYLYNDGDLNLENIKIEISESLENYIIITESISELLPGKSEKIKMNISSDLTSENITGQITVYSSNLTKYSTMEINFIEGFIPTEEENETDIAPDPSKSCFSQGGVICSSEETCSVETFYAKDGNCCKGVCEIKKDNPKPKIIGWVLVAIALAIVLYLFNKYRKTKNPINLLKIAEGRR
jgi:hypothetical protein